ncbi:putative nucleic acid-binding protein, contains PIN domain [Thioflavicoccus mobilis 8321]|uniref:Ribonuclease VapC n=1 Tax=Thioflavicoccus mobilis 8321 TaxID=765912 RepID=L0GR01_9GAMM|nr:PIN domain nuclease [Thioflavicoccus mobilis]AGA89173.1 putative nucleic acid-binding protein, contains PIN domain [Thioflavicoccus mobilis 8321]
MVLVDSSVWIDYFNGVPTAECDALDTLLGNELVLIGDLILTEVLQGFRTDAAYRQARTLLEPLTLCRLGGRKIALAAADHYRYLRRRGVTVRKTIDVIIASYCLLHDVELLHVDRDFDAIEQHLGLRVHRLV